MGFFGPQGFVTKAIKKIKSQQQDTSNPGHTHGSKDSGGGGGVDPIDNSVASGRGTVKGDVSRVDSAMIAPSFMDANMDDFASLTDPSSVGRKGNVIASATTALPLAGQVPSDIPPEDAFKITPRQDIDGVGMNGLIKDNLYS